MSVSNSWQNFYFWVNYPFKHLNEWMMHLYSDLLCIAVHPKRFTIMCVGGSLLNHHQCAASTWMMWRLPQDNTGAQCAHHTVDSGAVHYRWRGERVIEPIKWKGIIRRTWLIRASGCNLARTPGLHPYSLREVPWDFFLLMAKECKDLGLTSHPKDSAF